MILPTDKISIWTNEELQTDGTILTGGDPLYGTIIRGRNLESIVVVANGFTCKMTAEEFFKIIHEAHKW
jgi:hypothetical protein